MPFNWNRRTLVVPGRSHEYCQGPRCNAPLPPVSERVMAYSDEGDFMKFSVVLAITVSVAVLVSCGGSSNSNTPSAVNGCMNFTDATGASASRTINFGGASLGNAYSPNCLAVAAGQQVTFTGSFSTHPLAPGAAASARGVAGRPNNPLQGITLGITVTFTFPAAGTYPYFCSAHQNLGMYWATQVR